MCVEVSEDRVVRNGFMLKACLSPRTRVASRPGLLPRTMSGSVVLLQPGSLLTYVACLWSGLPPVTILVSRCVPSLRPY